MDKNKEKEDQSIIDKSMRSVFVGNIPYEATEEKLKDIFSEVGPVLSFKLVFDRETGKPKGYGFCEYKDQETALSAMRNLNGYEIGGRSLRVDNACTEKSRMEMQALMQGPQIENPYGEPIESDKAPEAISKAVASLPPEQMFELMKQMKLCIQNNPSEARNMLLQNPQLAYALLQAQVVMRIVDPATAVSMLHPPNQPPPVLQPSDKPIGGGVVVGASNVPTMPNVGINSIPPPPLITTQREQQSMTGIMPQPVPQPFSSVGGQDVDLRSLGEIPRPVSGMGMGQGMGQGMGPGVGAGMGTDPRMPRASQPPQPPLPPLPPSIPSALFPLGDQDMRSLPPPLPMSLPQDNYPRDPRVTGPGFPVDPRQRPSDPRQVKQGPPAVANSIMNSPSQRTIPGIPNGATDQEKAALIMQVLQLSDEQIAMLPPEQKTSILVLKEQIAKSTQR